MYMDNLISMLVASLFQQLWLNLGGLCPLCFQLGGQIPPPPSPPGSYASAGFPDTQETPLGSRLLLTPHKYNAKLMHAVLYSATSIIRTSLIQHLVSPASPFTEMTNKDSFMNHFWGLFEVKLLFDTKAY